MKSVGVATVFIVATVGVALADGPQGKWTPTNGKFTVMLRSCGQNLCANIVALKEPSYANGEKKIDRHNKDKSLRSRPLLGLALLSHMKPISEDSWQGEVYNPDDGNTYSATISLDGDQMRLQGCVAGILCKTEKFIRLP